MKKRTSHILDNSGLVTNSKHATFYGARLIPDGDDLTNTLTIYDSSGAPEYNKELAYLDNDVLSIDLGNEGLRCADGLYAFLPKGGRYIVYYAY